MSRIKLSEQDKLRNRVLKRYPGAVAAQNMCDEWFIEWQDQNLNETFLLSDCETELDAWRQAATVASHEQHFNRTHPLKQMWSETAKRQNKERIAMRIHYDR